MGGLFKFPKLLTLSLGCTYNRGKSSSQYAPLVFPKQEKGATLSLSRLALCFNPKQRRKSIVLVVLSTLRSVENFYSVNFFRFFFFNFIFVAKFISVVYIDRSPHLYLSKCCVGQGAVLLAK